MENDTCRHILAEMLAGWVGRVETTKSGEAALEALDRDGFDMVFTDMHLPDMDGMGLAWKIREICGENCPHVIMLTPPVFRRENGVEQSKEPDEWLFDEAGQSIRFAAGDPGGGGEY